jgi:hypothetical protein
VVGADRWRKIGRDTRIYRRLPSMMLVAVVSGKRSLTGHLAAPRMDLGSPPGEVSHRGCPVICPVSGGYSLQFGDADRATRDARSTNKTSRRTGDRLARSVPEAPEIGDSLVARSIRLQLGSMVYDRGARGRSSGIAVRRAPNSGRCGTLPRSTSRPGTSTPRGPARRL